MHPTNMGNNRGKTKIRGIETKCDHRKAMAAGVWRKNASFLPRSRRGRKENQPLKAIFAQVAAATGRKPNSVRNYYYARVKEQDLQTQALHVGAFVPFGQDEIRQLLRRVLSAQANGISVRACTLEMGDGDNKAMLRYQNKYRSLLKTRPDLVRQVAAELAAEGVHFDPYAASRAKPGRPAPQGEPGGSRELGRLLKQVEGVDGGALLEELHALALRAREQKHASQETSALKAYNATLRERLERQNAELEAQRERFHALLGMYRQLLGANREFLSTSGIAGMGSLSGYVRDLSRSVAAGEAALGDVSS